MLWEMAREEARDAILEADFVVLPCGSMEQHSLHLPVSTDSIRAEELTKYIAEHSEGLRMVVLPTLVYGESLHHMRFPGTVTLTEKTYIDVVKDIAWSLKEQGARRLLLINYHGGNLVPLQLAAGEIERGLGLKVYIVGWSAFASDLVKAWYPDVQYGHACFYETSMILHFRPDLVDKNKMVKQEQRFKRETLSRPVTRQPSAAYFSDDYITGGIGDPTLAKAELAAGLIPEVTSRIVKALKEDMQYE